MRDPASKLFVFRKKEQHLNQWHYTSYFTLSD